ncbi:hypothetical protein ASG90_13075 [Nocardioides sp. Soil797]|nr:hypothetical protein ASG90_13075 [Nocardioides sp. Soil797]
MEAPTRGPHLAIPRCPMHRFDFFRRSTAFELSAKMPPEGPAVSFPEPSFAAVAGEVIPEMLPMTTIIDVVSSTEQARMKSLDGLF